MIYLHLDLFVCFVNDQLQTDEAGMFEVVQRKRETQTRRDKKRQNDRWSKRHQWFIEPCDREEEKRVPRSHPRTVVLLFSCSLFQLHVVRILMWCGLNVWTSEPHISTTKRQWHGISPDRLSCPANNWKKSYACWVHVEVIVPFYCIDDNLKIQWSIQYYLRCK